MCELGLVRICLGLLPEHFVQLGLYSGVFRSVSKISVQATDKKIRMSNVN